MTGFKVTAAKVLIFTTICAIIFVMLWNTMRNVVDGDTNTWKARFTSASGLRAGDDVRVAGVKVGRVESVEVVKDDETNQYVSEVEFLLVEEQPIYETTQIMIRYQNLLGQRYLSLTAADNRGDEMSPDDTLSTSQTDPGFDLTRLLNGFQPLFDVLEPSDVNKFAENIVAVLQDQGPAVETLLQQATDVAGNLASKDAVFDQVFENLTPVLENLASQSDNFDATVQQLTELMDGLAKNRKVFADSIDNFGGLLDTTSALLADIRPHVDADVAKLRQTADVLATNKERISRSVDALPVVFGGLARAGSYYSALDIYFCNVALDIGGLGPIWIGGSDGPYSEVCQ